MQDLIKEDPSAVAAFVQPLRPATPTGFSTILKEENPVGVAGRKGIVSHHKDCGTKLLVDALDGREQHLRRMAVQCAGGLIGQ